MSTFKPDAGIPVLTEIIDAPVLDENPQPASLRVATAPASAADLERWEHLERELRERVLQQVLKQIDAALEQRVRDSLADVLQIAVENLAGEIRDGLRRTVKEVVTQAVRQEIATARASRN